MPIQLFYSGKKLVIATIIFFSCVCITSCSLQKKLSAVATNNILNVPALQSAHIGISIYEPATGKYWYNYQAEKYFIPASNAKIFTVYAGLKFLGDSLTSARYAEDEHSIFLLPASDPSVLHPRYTYQPLIHFLQQTGKKIFITNANWKEDALGAGWSWDDYNFDYMAERSALPVYGNVIKFVQAQTEEPSFAPVNNTETSIYTIPEINFKLNFNPDTSSKTFFVERKRDDNIFTVTQGREKYKEQVVPFSVKGIQSALELLKDTTGKEISIQEFSMKGKKWNSIKSQPVDSLFKPMMHSSDNFFAEQTLLMVSNEVLGYMNDDKIVDTLLKSVLKDIPQKPHWVDGCGLSRYNQFTPMDFVWVLDKMKKEFPWKRIANILPTGNQGTLSNYYVSDSSFIYAKTGSLSGQIALSGYLVTKKNKSLIFSVLVNNHSTSGTMVRRSVEKFIKELREKY